MIQQNVLIIGSGGREHALAWKIAQSPILGRLFCAPGNAGTAAIATNVPLAATDITGLVDFAKSSHIDLTVVGPDDILAIGMVDAFQKEGLRIFGPTKAAARIESSKAFSKALMTNCHVPTTSFKTFTDFEKASNYVGSQTFPIVVKASGLALGKGVYICPDKVAARVALGEIMADKKFGDSGSEVVIEDYCSGQEVSVHAFCDGSSAVLFPPAQDHKRIFDGDNGPNTGGMGAYAPVPWVTPEFMENTRRTVVSPILDGLRDGGSPFVGLLYPGLMVDSENVNVLEYNSRFGDPETQVFMRLLNSDLLEIFNACVDGKLADIQIQWKDQTAVCVVLASGGYPGQVKKGFPITGLEEAAALSGVEVFHSGTSIKDGAVVTAGGRVVCVSAVGADIAIAREKAYEAAKLIHFEGVQYRSDIGNKSL